MKKIVVTGLVLLLSSNANAGFKGLTHHSRANCGGFNESVTWWFNHAILARVQSYHYLYGAIPKSTDPTYHLIDLPKTNEWRHAAYHPTESYGGTYSVVGHHYMYIKGSEVLVEVTSVIDCSIYDGWWG